MRRRDFLKAGLGAAVAGALTWERKAEADPSAPEWLRLNAQGPVYQAASPALNLTDAVTLEAWVKADPMPQGGGRILDKLVPGDQRQLHTGHLPRQLPAADRRERPHLL